MELNKFIDLFLPGGDIYVVYWTEDSEKEEAPLWAGSLVDTPYWIAATFNIERYDKDWDAAINFRNGLGKENNNKPGLVITLAEKEDI